MPESRGNKLASKRTLTRILVLGILLLFGLLVAVFVKYRGLSENPAQIVEALPEGADIAIDDVRHTAVKDGRKTWSLEAASASYSDSLQTATFEAVQVVFFRHDGSEVMVTGNRGQLNIDTNDIEINGNVVVQDDDYRLNAERLRYDQAQRMIRIPVPVTISGPSLALEAEQMTVDLDREIARLKGSVKGVFSGKQTLPF